MSIPLILNLLSPPMSISTNPKLTKSSHVHFPPLGQSALVLLHMDPVLIPDTERLGQGGRDDPALPRGVTLEDVAHETVPFTSGHHGEDVAMTRVGSDEMDQIYWDVLNISRLCQR